MPAEEAARVAEIFGSNCAIIGEFRKDGSVKATAMILDGAPVYDYVRIFR